MVSWHFQSILLTFVNAVNHWVILSSLNSDAGAGILEIVSAETGASQMTTSRRCSRHTMARCLSRGAHFSGGCSGCSGFTFCALCVLCVLCVLFRRFVPFDFLLNAVSVSRPWSRDVMSWAWRVRQLIFNGEVGPWVNFHSRPFQPILFGFYRFLMVSIRFSIAHTIHPGDLWQRHAGHTGQSGEFLFSNGLRNAADVPTGLVGAKLALKIDVFRVQSSE